MRLVTIGFATAMVLGCTADLDVDLPGPRLPSEALADLRISGPGAGPADARADALSDAGGDTESDATSDDGETGDDAPCTAGCSGRDLIACDGDVASSVACPFGCDETSGCISPTISNIPIDLLCDSNAPSLTLVDGDEIDGELLLVGGDPVPNAIISQDAGMPAIAVLALANLTVEAGASVRLTGERAIALLVCDDVVLDGVIDGCAEFDQPGPGGFWGGWYEEIGDGPGSGGEGGYSVGLAGEPQGGGGGGGFGGLGGRSGATDGDVFPGVDGGSPVGDASLVPLLGGGGGGGAITSHGGGGGGALQIVAGGDVIVARTGGINMCGAGGSAPENAAGSGGGGGAGGAVLIQAAGVDLEGKITANGGGGGGSDLRASDLMTQAQPGEPGVFDVVRAAGGASDPNAGALATNGGRGGAGSDSNGSASAGGAGVDSTGGGGGAAGRVRIETVTGLLQGATGLISPQPSYADLR